MASACLSILCLFPSPLVTSPPSFFLSHTSSPPPLFSFTSLRWPSVPLRQTIACASPPCIPFLGLYLTDITFMEDGSPDYLPLDPAASATEVEGSDIINFSKRWVSKERERVREGVCEGVCEGVREGVCEGVREGVRVCVRVREGVCVCVHLSVSVRVRLSMSVCLSFVFTGCLSSSL